MKLKLIALSLFAATIANSSAALITLNGGSGATASGIQTTTGQTFRSGTLPGDAFAAPSGGTSAGPGSVAIGFFTTDSLSGVTSVSGLVSLFVQFGNAGTFAAAGATGNRSNFSSPQNVTVGGSQFADKFIYLFAGNGTTLANSTEVLVVKGSMLFGSVSDSLTTPTSFTFRPETTTLLFGSLAANVLTANTDTSTTAGWTMAAPVPEPSVALLGLLGVAGLIRRRR